MLLCWQPCLGRGTSKSIQQPEYLQERAQRLNMQLKLQLGRCAILDKFFSVLDKVF